jgi:hypothetical protein
MVTNNGSKHAIRLAFANPPDYGLQKEKVFVLSHEQAAMAFRLSQVRKI